MRKFMFFFLGIAAIACTEISYKEPQPKGIKSLSEIPTNLHGKYLMDKDTVYLFDKGLRGKDQGKEEVLYLSDSIVLKEYKKYYFFVLNFRKYEPESKMEMKNGIIGD